MYQYLAFGLSINSEIELPALLKSKSQHIDLTIKLDKVSKSGLLAPQTTGLYTQFSANEFWLHVPEIAQFKVENGNKITIECDTQS